MAHKEWSKTTISSILISILSKIAGAWKVSVVVGSTATFFSLANCITPLAGAFGGISGALSASLCLLAIKCVLGSFTLKSLLVYHLPTLCASLALAKSTRLVRVGLFALSILLFSLHHVGSQALIYSALWILPMLAELLIERFYLARAFSATMVAHAVGSLAFLYIQPMTPGFWIALTPLALVERVIFALGITAVYQTVQICSRLFVRSTVITAVTSQEHN